MSNPIFSAKFTVESSHLVSGYSDRWTVSALVEDFEGIWSGSDVQSGDVVFLDTQGEVPLSGSVCRYEVISVVSANGSNVELVLEYADTGTPVDPIIAYYQLSFIGRKSSEGFGWLAAADVQGISHRIVTYARNYDMTTGVNNKIQTKASKDGLQTIVHTIVPAESITKSFTLPFIPADPTDVIMDVVGGIDGTYGVDFIITGDAFSWSGLGFDGLLGSGDVVRLVYFTI
jgi:hypothetical protein